MISPALLATLALGALAAALAVLMARLEYALAADVLAIGAAGLGIAAFVAVAWATLQRARRLPRRTSR